MNQKELAGQVGKNAQDQQAMSALYASLSTLGERQWFAAAVAEARAQQPDSDLLNYWYYKLKVEKAGTVEPSVPAAQPKPAGFSFFRRLMIEKRKAAISLAAVIGGIFSVALWWYIDFGSTGMDDRFVSATTIMIFAAGLWFLLVAIHQRPKELIIPLASFALFAGIYFIQLLFPLGMQLAPFPQVALLTAGLLMLFFSAHGIRSGSARQLPEAFEKFISKCIEVVTFAVLIAMAWSVVCGLGVGLLTLINVSISSHVMSFLFMVPDVACAFIALALVYDPSSDLSEQTSILDSSTLFSQIAWILSFVIGAFLIVYITILAPSSFSLILDTGSASSLLTSIVIVIQVVLFFLVGWIRQRASQSMLWLRRCVALLAVESAILSSVALYAILLRISAYGFTTSRCFALLYVGAFFCIAVATMVAMIRLLQQNKDLSALARPLFAIQLSGVIALIFSTVVLSSLVDVELLSARDQIGRVKRANEITVTLDRLYFSDNSLQVARLLKAEYESASPQFKADIVLTLYAMSTDWSRDPEEVETLFQYLQELEQQESEEDLKALLSDMESPGFRGRSYGYGIDESMLDDCDIRLASYLDVSLSEAAMFCQTSPMMRY